VNKPCRHQPSPAEWDSWDASWWTDDGPAAATAMRRNDGAWLVRRCCLDCRIAYYADEEYEVGGVGAPCPGCGGHRWHVWTLPMARRAANFARIDRPPEPFGTVEVDFAD